jgi:hypothetical protein
MEMDIQVAPVQALLRDTRRDLDELENTRTLLAAQERRMPETLGACTEIAEAAGVICRDVLGRDITAIMTRCNNAVEGVAGAVAEYLHGDEQMVRNVQRLAASVPTNYRPPRYGGALSMRPVE